LYIWGYGPFGKFILPHRVKASDKVDIQDVRISRAGLAVILSKQGCIYSWGDNSIGQLGHGDLKTRKAPDKIKFLK
jgi:alpha-tubulin suppressor-like RCC1 family protein